MFYLFLKKIILSWHNNGRLVPLLDPTLYKKPYSRTQLQQFPQFQALFNSEWDQLDAVQPTQDYSLVELFAGAGGLAIGLEKAGFKSVLLNEKDKHACQTLRFNRPEWNVVEGDIANVDFKHLHGTVDLLTGGFPCQPFSSAGKQLGFEDLRGTLVFEMIRAIKEIQPKVFLAENVKGLVENDSGKTLETIINIMESIGYTIIEKDVYKSIFYKTPQKRERLIIIGVLSDLIERAEYQKPPAYHKIMTVKDAFLKGELYPCDVPEAVGQKYPKRKAEILAHVPEGGCWRDLPLELQQEYMKESLYLGGGKTGMARRLAWDEPCLTLTCSPAQKQTERCHPEEDRPLTTREYARIQTFPDDWNFHGAMSQVYKQIGNAVPVNLAYALGKSIVRMLNKMHEQ